MLGLGLGLGLGFGLGLVGLVGLGLGLGLGSRLLGFLSAWVAAGPHGLPLRPVDRAAHRLRIHAALRGGATWLELESGLGGSGSGSG